MQHPPRVQPEGGGRKFFFAKKMCDVCGCELPLNRSGHVTRVCRRTHREGAKHRAAVAEQERAWWEAAEALRRQRRVERVHALALGLLVTRLRAAHGSMVEARSTWVREAAERLAALHSPELEAALAPPARQALALNAMRGLLRAQDHELLRILVERMGWE